MAASREAAKTGVRAAAASLVEQRARLLDQPDLRGLAFCQSYAALADAWLSTLLASATGGDLDGIALLAVGGFGRRELFPGSDLDLTLVHKGRKDIARVAEALWYPIWDGGIQLDHSVRTPKELGRAAEGDLKVTLGLLDARLVSGDGELGDKVIQQAASLWQTRASRWLPILAAAVAERHEARGDLAFLLEPDLKESRGGLRDVQAIRAAARATPVLAAWTGDAALAEASEVIAEARVELQRPHARHSDRLVLQEQTRVAEALGWDSADAFMTRIAGAGRTIAWASDDSWRRVASSQAGPSRRNPGTDRPISAGLVLRDGEIALATNTEVTADASLALRAAAASAQLAAPFARASLDRLAGETPTPATPWPDAVRSALVSVLGSGRPAIHAMETLDQRGLVVRLLPEWALVRNRLQHNPYHRFTVDRHLLETAANASALVRSVSRPDLLLIASFLHDIGKGSPGDHTDVGVVMVAELGRRMGYDQTDVATLVTLVRHHLLLADVGSRRDLDDPGTIELVAEAVGDRETLWMLAALTEADSRATGPTAWSPWKAGLVQALAERVDRHFADGPLPAVPSTLSDEQQRLLAGDELTVVPGDGRVRVGGPDQPSLLGVVAGTFALHNLDIRTATVLGHEHGGAVGDFEIVPTFGQEPDWAKVAEDARAAQALRLDLDRRLAEKAQVYDRRWRNPERAPVKVMVDNRASARSTVVEVRAPDGPAVLYRLARALGDCGLRVTWARVNTLGSEVVNTFYVKGPERGKLLEEAAIAAVERRILETLEPPGPAGAEAARVETGD